MPGNIWPCASTLLCFPILTPGYGNNFTGDQGSRYTLRSHCHLIVRGSQQQRHPTAFHIDLRMHIDCVPCGYMRPPLCPLTANTNQSHIRLYICCRPISPNPRWSAVSVGLCMSEGSQQLGGDQAALTTQFCRLARSSGRKTYKHALLIGKTH